MKDEPTKQGIRPMMATPGITSKRFCSLPLGTESEMSVGPDHINPYRSEEERRITEQIVQEREERKRREKREGDAFLETIPSERGRGIETPGPLGEPAGAWGTPITHEVPEFGFDVLEGVQAFDPFESGDGF